MPTNSLMPTPQKTAPTPFEQTVLLGFGVRRRRPNGSIRLYFRWGRIFTVFCIMLVGSYAALATGLYYFFKYRQDYDDVSYWKMYTVLFQREQHRREVGNYHIEQAKEELARGNFQLALHYLRSGVPRAPDNLEGRLLLAEFFLRALRRPDMALEVIERGLPYASEEAGYMQNYLQLLLSLKRDESIIAFMDANLNKPEYSPDINRMIALAGATAHYYRGNYAVSQEIIENNALDDTLEGLLLKSRILWDSGQQRSAIHLLETAPPRFSKADPLYAMLSRFQREQGNYSAARRYTILRSANNPLNVVPRIELLYILKADGQEARVRLESEAILREYGNDEQALLALANYGTEEGNVELVRRAYERALQNGFNVSPFSLLLVEAMLVGGDNAGAIEFIEEIVREQPDWLRQNMPIFDSLRAVAYFSAGNAELSQIYLNRFLSHKTTRVETLLAIAKRFNSLGGNDQARELLVRAYQQQPDNQAVLTALLNQEMSMGYSSRLNRYLTQLLDMRRPPRELLEQAYLQLGSDRFIFTPDRQDLLIRIQAMLDQTKPAEEQSG